MCKVEWFHQVLRCISDSAGKVLSVLITPPRGCDDVRQCLTTDGKPGLTSTRSLPELQRDSRLSRNSVKSSIDYLQGIGLVEVHIPDKSRDPHAATTYVVPILLPKSVAMTLGLRVPGREGHQKTPPRFRGSSFDPLNTPRQTRGSKFDTPLTTHDDDDDLVLHLQNGSSSSSPPRGYENRGSKLDPLIASKVWLEVLDILRGEISPGNWETWVKNTTGESWDGRIFVVAVPNSTILEWLQRRLRSLVRRRLIDTLNQDVEVQFRVSGATEPALAEEPEDLVTRLEKIGLDHAQSFVEKYPEAEIEQALERLSTTRKIKINNPAGFVRSMLERK